MFDIGWTEMLVIAVVMILVVGPKDLPGMLRTIGKTIGNVRRMAGDFQRQFNDALKEAEIDEVKKDLTQSTSMTNLLEDPLADINKSADELMGSLDTDMDDGDLAKENFDKIKQEIAEGKAKENSSSVTSAKPAASGKKPARKAPAKKAATGKVPAKKATARKAAVKKAPANSAAKKPAAKPAAKTVAKSVARQKPSPGTKPTLNKSVASETKTGSKTA